MQYAVTNIQNQDQTIFSLLSDGNGLERSTTADVKRVLKTQVEAAPFRPWYSKVQTQTLNLTEEVKKQLGFDPDPDYQPEVNDNSEFWQKICLMGLDNGMLTEHEISFLLEAPVGTPSQIQAAEAIGDKILSAYGDRVAHYEKRVIGNLSANGATVGIKNEYREWYEDLSQSCWGFDLTLDDAYCYGEDYDEYDRNFNGIGLRIEHSSRVSTLNFNLDDYSPALGKMFYKTICFLANMSYKSNAINYCDSWGGTEENAKILIKAKLTDDQILTIAHSDEKSVGDVLQSISPSLLEQFEEELTCDPNQVINGAAYIVSTTMNPWYCDNPFDSNGVPQFVAMGLREELKKARTNPLNTNEDDVKKTLDAVLQTVIENVHLKEHNPSWLQGSDNPIDGYAFVSFDSTLEDQTLECENEHRQSVGEYGAMRLNLDSGKAGFETIENILLGDLCLLTLCSLQ
jgi:hypothetical protein